MKLLVSTLQKRFNYATRLPGNKNMTMFGIVLYYEQLMDLTTQMLVQKTLECRNIIFMVVDHLMLDLKGKEYKVCLHMY